MFRGFTYARLVLSLALLLLLCGLGCGQDGAGTAAVTDIRGLPALPLDQPAPAGPKAATLQLLQIIPGADAFSFSNNTIPSGQQRQFLPLNNELAWAVYRVTDIGPELEPQHLKLTLASTAGPYYVGLANYARGAWDFTAPQQGNYERDLSASLEKYTSPGGNFYFMLLSAGSGLLYDRAEVTLRDDRPLAAPQGLQGSVGNTSVVLSWDPYTDTRASELRVYYSLSPDMSSPVLDQTLDTNISTWGVDGLSNDVTYYFVLRAANSDGLGPPSEVFFATPSDGPPEDFGLASGLWARYGSREDGSGTTLASAGPANLQGLASRSLISGDSPGGNRTSPVIDKNGNVYACTRDGQLVSYSSDLLTERFRFNANDFAGEAEQLVCPPHAPCIDTAGNLYFIAINSGGGQGYLFSVSPAGSRRFQYELGSCPENNDHAYPAPNIGPLGVLFAVSTNQQVLSGLDQDGSELWKSLYNDKLEFRADATYNFSNQSFELPCVAIGNVLGQPRHWLRVGAAAGDEQDNLKNFGTPDNRAGGISFDSGYYVYPEGSSLLLLNSTGLLLDSFPLGAAPKVGPSRVAASDYVVQCVPGGGTEADPALLKCYRLNYTPDFDLTFAWSLELGPADVLSKPSVDKDGRIYLADSSGKLWLVQFDPALPVQEGTNPQLLDSRAADGENSYYFNSLAIGNNCVYAVTEQDRIQQFYNPLD